jgi:hypothetical protein
VALLAWLELSLGLHLRRADALELHLWLLAVACRKVNQPRTWQRKTN